MSSFTLLETRQEILNAQTTLEKTITKEFTRTEKKNIGFPGGINRNAPVSTNNKYWHWSGDYAEDDTPNPRRLNWFGIFETTHDLQITVEINVAYEGTNAAIAGFFAKDTESGNIYLFHTGRVGGGTKGVGKFSFLAWSNYQLHNIFDSDGNERTGILVMPITGKYATSSLSRYIEKIANFKIAVRQGDLNTKEFEEKKSSLEEFYSESSGQRKGTRSATIDYLSRHGEVVDALYEWRNLKSIPGKNTRIVKNIFIDLGVATNEKLVELYEVKTSTDRSVIYGAIGQLVTHGIENDCQLHIVLPENGEIAPDLLNAFKKLNISILRFSIDTESVKIK